MSKKTLYRQYRPQSFQDVYGQEHVKKTLSFALSSNNYAHSYLFAGPRGVGKTTIARIISRSVNCENKKEGEFEPCNTCSACTSILDGSAIDVIEIDAASNRGIDEVRQLRENARTSTSILKKKVFIIDEVHMLTKEAFDALLKTLEEPAAHIMFILATTELHKIPATIISRCQVFEFKTLNTNDLVNYLKKIADQEKKEISEEVLQFIARFSGGYVRDAVSLLGQVFTFQTQSLDEIREFFGIAENGDAVDFINAILQKDGTKAFHVLSNIRSKGKNIETFSNTILEYIRIGLISLHTPNNAAQLGIDQALLTELQNILSQADTKHITQITSRLAMYMSQFGQTGHADLAIDLVIAEFCELSNQQISTPPTQPLQPLQPPQPPQQPTEPKQTRSEPQPPTPPQTAPANHTPVEPQTNNPPIPDHQQPTPAPATPPEPAPVTQESNQAPTEHTNTQQTEEATENSTPEPQPTPTPQPSGEIDLETIKSKWTQIIDGVHQQNRSLAAVLKNTCILGVKSGILVLVVDFEIHQDRVNQAQSRQVIRSVFSSVLGEAYGYECTILTELTPDEQEKVNNIRNVQSAQKKEQLSQTYDIVTDVFDISSDAEPNN